MRNGMEAVFWVATALLFYVYCGYALLLQILPRRRESPGTIGNPTVSVIIPAHNEEPCLRETLSNLFEQLASVELKVQIIVASDGSSDRTAAVAREFETRGVVVLEFLDQRGKSSVLNDAVAMATGDVLCLCDANVLIQPDALNSLIGRLADPSVGAVSGDVRLDSERSNFGIGESLYYRLERGIQSGESRVGSLMGVDGGMYVMRRKLFRPLPAGTILDDFAISMGIIRQGYRIVYEPRAVAHEVGTPFAMPEFRRRIRVSAGSVQALRQGSYPSWRQPVELWQFASHKLLRWLDGIWLIALLVSSAWLATSHWIFATVLTAQVVAYGSGIVAALVLAFRGTRWGNVSFYFLMSHIAMLIGLVRGVLNRQAVMWTPVVRGTVQGRVGGLER